MEGVRGMSGLSGERGDVSGGESEVDGVLADEAAEHQGKSKAVPSAASAVMRWIRLSCVGARIAPERQIHIAALHGKWSVARAPARLLSSGAWW